MSHASGTYVARMDADDMSEKTRLEEQLRYMEKTDVVLCGLWAKGIDEKGNILYPLHYPPEKDKDILAMLVKHNPFIHPSVMFKKESFVSVGGYHSFFKYVEDYELWTRMIAKGSLGNIGKELIFYRLHDVDDWVCLRSLFLI